MSWLEAPKWWPRQLTCRHFRPLQSAGTVAATVRPLQPPFPCGIRGGTLVTGPGEVHSSGLDLLWEWSLAVALVSAKCWGLGPRHRTVVADYAAAPKWWRPLRRRSGGRRPPDTSDRPPSLRRKGRRDSARTNLRGPVIHPLGFTWHSMTGPFRLGAQESPGTLRLRVVVSPPVRRGSARGGGGAAPPDATQSQPAPARLSPRCWVCCLFVCRRCLFCFG